MIMRIWLPAVKTSSGSDVYVQRLSTALQKRGIDVVVSWFHSGFELAPWLLRLVPPPRGVDIIHINSWHGPAFYRRGIPLVVTCHHVVHSQGYLGFVTPFQRLYHRLLVKRWEEYSMRRASRVIADSRFTADCIFEVFGRKDTEVIHLWVDTGRFVPAQGPKRRGNGPFRLLFLGNPIKRKGFDLLPEVMKRLGPEFVLYYTAGRSAVHLRDMPPNMICLGRLSQEGVIRELQRAHALLFPSRFEGFGYAALEAMACGVPVIAARSSAIPEVVEHEKTGILCEIDDVSGLVQACRLLAENEGLRLNLAGQAREAAVARFNEEELLSQYLRLYEAL